MQELQALLHRNGLPSWYVGQCAHVCRHGAMLFSNASCNYYQARDCQARRAKDVTITTVCRRVPASDPQVSLQKQRLCTNHTGYRDLDLVTSRFTLTAEVRCQPSHKENGLPLPQPNAQVLSLYLETIMRQQVGNGISHTQSPRALFVEFYICFVRVITLGHLESHFLINNFCFCGQDQGSPFLKMSLFLVIPKEEYTSCFPLARFPLWRSVQNSCWVSQD